MALTETQQLDIAEILSVEVWSIEDQIDALGSYASAAWETKVEAQITRWETVGIDFTAIEPKERNFGARINPEQAKADVRQHLATLFQRPDWLQRAGSSVRLQRG